uniref:Uncharacterized protein n=1 Tax=Oryza glumipatula TaxID=40148 RepID=A0A0D9ZKM4_9ORYZ
MSNQADKKLLLRLLPQHYHHHLKPKANGGCYTTESRWDGMIPVILAKYQVKPVRYQAIPTTH